MKSLNKVSELLLGGLKLVLMSGVFTEPDLHKVDLLVQACLVDGLWVWLS